jgi:hypothetical protein
LGFCTLHETHHGIAAQLRTFFEAVLRDCVGTPAFGYSVSFSSARTTNRFSSQCASAIQNAGSGTNSGQPTVQNANGPCQPHRVAAESFLIAGWQMIRLVCHRRTLERIGWIQGNHSKYPVVEAIEFRVLEHCVCESLEDCRFIGDRDPVIKHCWNTGVVGSRELRVFGEKFKLEVPFRIGSISEPNGQRAVTPA